MGRWSREELESAFEHYQRQVRQATAETDWNHFADLFVEDAIYEEHVYGQFHGRDEIRPWILETMKAFPGNAMTSFPAKWHVVDVDRGWIIADVVNVMADPGDGSVHEASNITILHYAGDMKFSHEEDVYNPMRFLTMVQGWGRRAAELGTLPADGAAWLQSMGGSAAAPAAT